MDENKIQKPISMVKQEFSEKIVDMINNSGLPIFLIEYVLKDIMNGVHAASVQQLETDTRIYQEQLEKSKNQTDKNNH